MNGISTPTAYGNTGFFSAIILDYLQGEEQLKPFYAHPVSVEGLKAAMEERKHFATDRKLLVEVLNKHYTGEKLTARQKSNIELLGNTNTFTVTTAHQPNIFTGHLYFIYKILHSIKLCETLKADMPENDFVPVFFMGSEDADLEELGHVFINGVKHEWDTKQTGAVGRMKVDKALIKILTDIEGEITVHPFGAEIISLMKTCYTEGSTIEQATFKLVNELFGQYGLLILLPDDADYKRAFIPIVEKELKDSFSHSIVEAAAAGFPKAYKVQASGRELNMFYLKDDKRERIEKQDSPQGSAKIYKIQGSDLEFSEKEIIDELKEFPERFSANVILRPVFQEMILPNIAFIGGGGEIAYWLELKNVFAAVDVPYPVLVLRNSFLMVEKKYAEKLVALGFTINDLFKSEQDLLTELVKRESSVQLNLNKERATIHTFYVQLKITAGAVDSTLQAHTEALEKLALRKIDALEKKMLRAEKKKFEAQQRQLHNLKNQLFPHNNLQERIENFMPFYAKWGSGFISFLFDNSLSLQQQFVVLEEF